MESVLAAMCDRLQTNRAFAATLNATGMELLVSVGNNVEFDDQEISENIMDVVLNGERDKEPHLFSWGDFWIFPLFSTANPEEMLGFLGVEKPADEFYDEQKDALQILINRAHLALDDRYLQQQVFNSIEMLTPQMDRIQQLRAAARYDGTKVLTSESEVNIDEGTLTEWVKNALSDYWGGPDLSESPLLQLEVVQNSLDEHEGITVRAIRAILREAIEKIRPEGTRRFTLDWVLYNILEMKFLKGQKVRDVAKRLAMSEANLYRKQKIAIEVVAKTIMEMEKQAREEGRKSSVENA
jgi:hypothetical protein